jgi:hypothetical protein
MTRAWDSYFTPPELSRSLLASVSTRPPRVVVDICAGHGNLLRAARARWPEVGLVGNDLYRDRPKKLQGMEWHRRDGRHFAREMFQSGLEIDLVVGNPPFGRSRIPRLVSGADEVDLNRLLRSPRIECGMVVASALLVGPRGTLATLVPDSMVRGSSYHPLRSWLAGRFEAFQVIRLGRQMFGRRDLGVAFLIAHRIRPKRELPGLLGTDAFAHAAVTGSQPHADFVARGVITTADFNARGSAAVLHCNRQDRGCAYQVQHTTADNARSVPNEHWVAKGDIIVCRVGRNAGVATVYQEREPALVSDCVFRVFASKPERHQVLQARASDGTLTGLLTRHAHGLGAQFVCKSDVTRVLDSVAGVRSRRASS